MDTINGIPALADTDPAALIGQYSRDLRATLLTRRLVLTDAGVFSGITNGSIQNASATCDYAGDGSRAILWRAQVSGVTTSSGTQNTAFATLNTDIAPRDGSFTPWDGINASGDVVSGLVSSGGVLTIRWASAAISGSTIFIRGAYGVATTP